ncbi:MAG: glycosyltransferase [Anaerolineae bacterium]
MKPTLVVTAYNRPHALRRLLHSLCKAEYPPGVRLVISIDTGGEHTAKVRRLAADFRWPHGDKQVIQHEKKLGLIGNVFFGGGLSQTYGAVILLEDDLFVSPMFYHYAQQALDFYADDSRIAGISLNALWFNGFTHHPFTPYLDDADVFFMQVAWYQGQAYTGTQWAAFTQWREKSAESETAVPLHELFSSFPDTDWFPLKTRYLAETDRFYVFPRQSLTTNFGDIGTHFDHTTRFFQVPLQTFRRQFRLSSLDDSVAVFDSFQELLPRCLNQLTDRFRGYDYAVDLNGAKSPANLRAEYVLTTRRCRSPLFTFGKVMRPLAANVVEGVPGNGIYFGKTADLEKGRLASLIQQQSNDDYFMRGRRLGRRKRMLFWLARLLQRAGVR